jgi:thioredoxin reductase
MDQFDVIVIGAGPAGVVAALRAGDQGAKTASVDPEGPYLLRFDFPPALLTVTIKAA